MKKKFYLSLAVAACLSLTACGSSSATTAEASAAEQTTAAETAAETTAETTAEDATAEGSEESVAEAGALTVTDMNGREVTIEGDIERVVLTALPLPSIYALTGAPIENLVGVHPGSTSAIENSIMGSMYPDLVGIADNFVEGQDINVE
nr:hypothetical protein [Lachnospiraceae bacterium]